MVRIDLHDKDQKMDNRGAGYWACKTPGCEKLGFTYWIDPSSEEFKRSIYAIKNKNYNEGFCWCGKQLITNPDPFGFFIMEECPSGHMFHKVLMQEITSIAK